MSQDLKRMLQSIEGQGPSEEFRARLRARIVAETEGRVLDKISAIGTEVAQTSNKTTAEVELELPEPVLEITSDQVTSPRRSRLLGAAAALIAAVIAFWALTQSSEFNVDTVETPANTTTTIVDDEAVPDADLGQQVTGGNIYVEQGAYRIDTLGTDFTFEVDQTTRVLRNGVGVVVLGAQTSEAADDRTLTFRRTSLLPSPTTPTRELDSIGSWPADDLAGWLANLSGDVNSIPLRATTLGGRDAVFTELTFACEGGEVCQAGYPLKTDNLPYFTPGSSYKVWIVDQGDEDSIVIIGAIDGDDSDDLAWFDRVDDLLSSLKFGEIGPNPVRQKRFGSLQLDVFDGIQLELNSPARVVEPYNGFAGLSPSAIAGGELEFLTRPLDIDGVEVRSTEQLLEIFQNQSIVTSEVETADIDGFETRAFAVDSGVFTKITLKTRTAELARPEFGWRPPQTGHVWIVEHPDRGLLIVASGASSGTEEALAIQEWVEAMLPTIEFQDS